MGRSFDPDDPIGPSLGSDPEMERLVEDLRTAFPAPPVPDGIADRHVAAMMAAVELAAEGGASHAGGADGRPSSPRRRTMRHRITVRVAAVATGLLLSLGGLAVAGAFPGSDDGSGQQAVVTDLDENVVLPDAVEVDDVADDQGENEDADEHGEDGDDQGEEADDNDDQGKDEGDADENDDQQGDDDNADTHEDGGDSQD